MADRLLFQNARFATAGMLPSSDEEVNALWGRKAANGAAKAYGEWGTIVVGTHPSFPERGHATIYFDTLGFSDVPTLDLIQVRGGTEPWIPFRAHGETYSDAIPTGVTYAYYPSWAAQTGRTTFSITVFNSAHRDDSNANFTVANQETYGTFLYRLRGN